MHTVSAQPWIVEGSQDKGVGDVRLMEYTVKDDHNGAVPAVIPEWYTTRHWWHNEHLKVN
jgi:hypothetical protein